MQPRAMSISPAFASSHWHRKVVSTSSHRTTTWRARAPAARFEPPLSIRWSGSVAQATLGIARKLQVLTLWADPITRLHFLTITAASTLAAAAATTTRGVAQYTHILHLLHHHRHELLHHCWIELIHSSISRLFWLGLSTASARGVSRELVIRARWADPVAGLHCWSVGQGHGATHRTLALAAILRRRGVLGVSAASAGRISGELMISACTAAPISRREVLSPIVSLSTSPAHISRREVLSPTILSSSLSALLHRHEGLNDTTTTESAAGVAGIVNGILGVPALAAHSVARELMVAAGATVPIAGFKVGHVPQLSVKPQLPLPQSLRDLGFQIDFIFLRLLLNRLSFLQQTLEFVSFSETLFELILKRFRADGVSLGFGFRGGRGLLSDDASNEERKVLEHDDFFVCVF